MCVCAVCRWIDPHGTDETGHRHTTSTLLVVYTYIWDRFINGFSIVLGQGFNNPFRSFVAAMFGEEHGGCIRGEAKGESPGAAY